MRFLSITEFIGHFHPVLVHLPIGILLAGLLLQWRSQKAAYRPLQPAVAIIFLWGLISSAAAFATGYLLSLNDDYDRSLVNWHMWMAIGVLCVSFLLYLKILYSNFAVNRTLLSAALLVLLTITGHLGGSLTHGSDYLSQPLQDIFSKDTMVTQVIRPLPDVQEALAYQDVVQPILQAKCSSCHNAKKQKGNLRMDDPARLLKGGKHGVVLVGGNADSSEMLRRLLLPANDEKHMPPKQKPQPSPAQVALLKWWISTGASFDKKVGELKQPEQIKPFLAALEHNTGAEQKPPADLPQSPVEKADGKLLETCKDLGITVMPVAQSSNYLVANFVNHPQVSRSDLELLKKLRKQLVWLRLENTKLTDGMMKLVAELTTLTRLNLANTGLTDASLPELAHLDSLHYLNLAGTKVSAAGLQKLASLKALKELYLFGTGMNQQEYSKLRSLLDSVSIDTGGYKLEMLASDTTTVQAPK